MINLRIKIRNKVVSLPIFDIDEKNITIIQMIDGKIRSVRLPFTAVQNPNINLIRLLERKGLA